MNQNGRRLVDFTSIKHTAACQHYSNTLSHVSKRNEVTNAVNLKGYELLVFVNKECGGVTAPLPTAKETSDFQFVNRSSESDLFNESVEQSEPFVLSKQLTELN